MLTIKDICEKIGNLIDTVRIPLPTIPAALIACGAINRPGLSPMLIASEIIRRQPEAGAYFGNLPDGSKNIMEAMEVIRAEVYCNAIKNDLKIETALFPGSIIIQNADGSTGTNASFGKTEGIAR